MANRIASISRPAKVGLGGGEGEAVRAVSGETVRADVAEVEAGADEDEVEAGILPYPLSAAGLEPLEEEEEAVGRGAGMGHTMLRSMISCVPGTYAL